MIKLENIESGREVWFFNTHNPASTPAAATTRTGAVSRSASRSGSPTSSAPTAPRSCSPATTTTGPRSFCPIVGGTELEAANGGGYSGGCDTPDRMDVDWIFGSQMEFSGFVSASQGVVGRVSDHPFIYAEAYIPEEPLGGEEGSEPTGDASPSGDSSETSED